MDLTTKAMKRETLFQKHTKRFDSILASSVSDTNRMTIRYTNINRIQEYEVNGGVTLDAAASGGHWGRMG